MWPLVAAVAVLTPAPMASLKAMSYNVRFSTANDGEYSWPHRKDRVYALLKREAADIIGLQEALRRQISEIRHAVPGYAEVGVGRDDGISAGEHCTILYRSDRFAVSHSGTNWFSETPEVVASKSWGNNITRIVTFARLVDLSSLRPLWVFNVHLDHESQPSRLKSVAMLRSKIASLVGKEPFVVLGDFNAGEVNPAILLMLEPIPGVSGIRDTFRAIHPGRKDVQTFNGWREGLDGDKIDYVFVSDAWAIRDAAIVWPATKGAFESDHYPVTATLDLN